MTLKLFFKYKKKLDVTTSLRSFTEDDYFAPSLLFIFNWKLCIVIRIPRMTKYEPKTSLNIIEHHVRVTKNESNHFFVFIFTFISCLL